MRRAEISSELILVIPADDIVNDEHNAVAAVGPTGQFGEKCLQLRHRAGDRSGMELSHRPDRGLPQRHDLRRLRNLPALQQPGAPLEEPVGHHLNLRFKGRHPIDAAEAARREKWQGCVALLRLEEADDCAHRVVPGPGSEMVEECCGDAAAPVGLGHMDRDAKIDVP